MVLYPSPLPARLMGAGLTSVRAFLSPFHRPLASQQPPNPGCRPVPLGRGALQLRSLSQTELEEAVLGDRLLGVALGSWQALGKGQARAGADPFHFLLISKHNGFGDQRSRAHPAGHPWVGRTPVASLVFAGILLPTPPLLD